MLIGFVGRHPPVAHIDRKETYCKGSPGRVGDNCPGQQIIFAGKPEHAGQHEHN